MKKRLFVMDPEQRLPSDFLEGVGHICDVVPHLPEQAPQDLLESGPWHGAVISVDGGAKTALTIARHLKKANPACAVILLGPLPTGESIREAFDVGVDVIVDPADYVDLYAAIVTRMSPSLVSSGEEGGPGPEPPAGAGEARREFRIGAAGSEAAPRPDGVDPGPAPRMFPGASAAPQTCEAP